MVGKPDCLDDLKKCRDTVINGDRHRSSWSEPVPVLRFFRRFRQLNVRSNNELDELVSQAEQIVQGVEPQSLRNNQVLRQTVASELAEAGRMAG